MNDMSRDDQEVVLLSRLVQQETALLASQTRVLERQRFALLLSHREKYGDQELVNAQIQALQSSVERLTLSLEAKKLLLEQWQTLWLINRV
jgi:hypothetical protein